MRRMEGFLESEQTTVTEEDFRSFLADMEMFLKMSEKLPMLTTVRYFSVLLQNIDFHSKRNHDQIKEVKITINR